MGGFLLRRAIQAPLVLFILAALTFFIIRLAPGDPFSRERAMDPAAQQALQERYHLDEPLIVQFGYWLGDMVQGDLGPSLKYPARSVNEIIAEHLPQSAWLGAVAVVLALAIGLTAGIVAAWRQHSAFDYASMSGAMLGLSVPPFVVGPILILIFGTKLGWLPVGQWGGGRIDHLILPAFTLALPLAARIARLARAGVLEIAHQDFVRTARAKGLPEWQIVMRHVLRGGLLPVVSFVGPAIAGILTGSLVVEQIFGIPGIGSSFVDAALNRDYTLVMATVLLYGAFLIFCNLLADIALVVLDPRVRLQ